jgi:hypothetical protein
MPTKYVQPHISDEAIAQRVADGPADKIETFRPHNRPARVENLSRSCRAAR